MTSIDKLLTTTPLILPLVPYTSRFSYTLRITPYSFCQVLMLSLNDLNWIEVGLFSRALFFGLFGVVRTGSELFFILTLLVLCGPVVPRIKSYLSKSVDPRHSSDLFAALAGIDAIRYIAHLPTLSI